jgi:hypothetical protein
LDAQGRHLRILEEIAEMRKLLCSVLVFATVAFGAPAFAINQDTWTYICDNGHLVSISGDLIRYHGENYDAVLNASCGKSGWTAKKRGKTIFDFCTATQGYGGLQFPGTAEIECHVIDYPNRE